MISRPPRPSFVRSWIIPEGELAQTASHEVSDPARFIPKTNPPPQKKKRPRRQGDLTNLCAQHPLSLGWQAPHRHGIRPGPAIADTGGPITVISCPWYIRLGARSSFFFFFFVVFFLCVFFLFVVVFVLLCVVSFFLLLL